MPELPAELVRLRDDAARVANWKRWGPYLSERQWGTVREDYSADGDCWNYFPHDDARSRAYRWGEDGLLGICDRECRLCFALALWNGRDPILKERLFGLSGPEGNHGEDVKELYYYLDSTPTHSYMKALYKYPQRPYPYDDLVAQGRARTRLEPEQEITDTDAFADNRYFDVVAEYAKAGPDDLLIRITVHNRGPERAVCHVLPTLWFRNSWVWGCTHEGCEVKPHLRVAGPGLLAGNHVTLGGCRLAHEASRPVGADAGVHDVSQGAGEVRVLVTENSTNPRRHFGEPVAKGFFKDAFHERVVHGREGAVNPKGVGTKAAMWHILDLAPGEARELRLRLTVEAPGAGEAQAGTPAAAADPGAGPGAGPGVGVGADFDQVFAARRGEADAFYEHVLPRNLGGEERNVSRQAYAGLLWSKQFYHYIVEDWLRGDADQPPPPEARKAGRNADWPHLYNRDVVSMPDKWEYPWYAAWDLAFHAVAFAKVDPDFAKQQLLLFLREWYMHPNGQIPAYEFALGDVNPPVHAWACLRVYKSSAPRGQRDVGFLASAFQKLLINFTWWVNRKDLTGRHLFSGGFLGLDNIGVLDRSQPLPRGGRLEQADGTAWMAFYSGRMLAIALELAQHDHAYEDMASKFFEHFTAIVDAMNTLGGTGLWDEEDGFYYDQLHLPGAGPTPLRVRSLVGLIPLLSVEILEERHLESTPGFAKRLRWFLAHRKDLARHVTYCDLRHRDGQEHMLLAVPSRERLVRVLRRLLDEDEFLSPFGVRSLSRVHLGRPYEIEVGGSVRRIAYDPGESTTAMFGGNSNWRGPVWLPVNHLIVEALDRYHRFYGDTLQVEMPTGSGRMMHLGDVAREFARRLAGLFMPDARGHRPSHGGDPRHARDEHFRDLLLFHEYFHGDTGRGCGASHQTGWTALVAASIERAAGEPS